MNRLEINLLYNEFKKINLVEFIEKEVGIIFSRSQDKFSCLCPMSNHKDSKPSFRVYKDNSGSLGECWLYHCFGCGSGGTIIDFCMQYYNLKNAALAVIFICDKMGLDKSDALDIHILKESKNKANLQKKIDCAHVIASRQCFSLLKKDYIKYNKWVAGAYRKMNDALCNEDLSIIEQVGFEASSKIQGKII